MTTCSECLNALSSARVSDIAPGSTIALHCATCPQCMRVADEVRYAEYRLSASLNEARPGFRSEEVAVAAVEGSELRRRRRIGRWVRGVLALIALGIFGAAWEARRGGNSMPAKDLVIETIQVNCLSGKKAAQLVTPYLRSNGSVVYHVDDLVTIRGTRDEFVAATMALKEFDNPASCTISPPATTTPAPTTSDAMPGKD